MCLWSQSQRLQKICATDIDKIFIFMIPKYYELAVNKALKENVDESQYSDLLEVFYSELVELSINQHETHDYERTSQYTWDFIDRVGNRMRVLLLPLKNDVKSAYVIEVDGKEFLVYDKDKLQNKSLIVDLPDERRLNTIYKIVTKEIVPEFLLNKSPNKLSFTPISKTRDRLVKLILNKVATDHPELQVKGNLLVYNPLKS